MKRYLLVTLILVLCGGIPQMKAQRATPIDSSQVVGINRLWDLAQLSRVPQVEWLPEVLPSGVRALRFKGVDFQGKPTSVFAYYCDPDLLMHRSPKKGRSYPGVLLLHGGAGTAFSQWVEKWAAEGYAALTLDLCGVQPGVGRMEDGGPDLSNTEDVFLRAEQSDFRNMWSYHAVAQAIMAHSLLRSLRSVDADRTAVTGISWGGYLTCIVAALDSRFRAAAPVYGCGYMDELPFFDYGMGALSEQGRRAWMSCLDPSLYLPAVRTPMLFVVGNNDPAFDVPQHRRSEQLVDSSLRWVSIHPGMQHGYYEGWAPDEICAFFNSQMNDDAPLCRITAIQAVEDSLKITFHAPVFMTDAQFYYTSDTLSRNVDRLWHSCSGRLDRERGTFTVPLPAEGFRFGFATLTDVRKLSVSTPFLTPQDL